jgi:cytochrome c biogenesis protein CcmG, thiol:disulfide interchange protein DsbE
MIRKISFLLLIAGLASSVSLAQSIYYKSKDGTILDSAAYNKSKNTKIEKIKAAGLSIELDEELVEEYRNKDSIVFKYAWAFNTRNTVQDELLGFDARGYIGKPFPIATLTSMDKKIIDLSYLKGKPSLLNFWFTTCKPCIEEMPVLNKLKAAFKDSVNFVAITYEKTDKVVAFLKKHVYDFVQVADAEKLINALQMTSFPINIFLDKNGSVVRVENGIPFVVNGDKKLVMGDGKLFTEILRKLL